MRITIWFAAQIRVAVRVRPLLAQESGHSAECLSSRVDEYVPAFGGVESAILSPFAAAGPLTRAPVPQEGGARQDVGPV